MPKPKPNEKQDDFISRCIPIVMNEGTAEDDEQAAAICYSMWREDKKMKNADLLKAIRARNGKKTQFNYGIMTADRYVKTVSDAIGLDSSYRFMAKEQTSFSDVMEKASQTLVYSNEDMLLEEKGVGSVDGIELPKNTLMVFRHVLTTPRKDRDGDILRTEGMNPDPKMLLLWQHVHTLPIGKMLRTVEHNTKVLRIVSCIVDMNALCHDAAVMVDNDMGRFSHGFRAVRFDKVKESPNGAESGFDIKEAEIMEESLVSVPANVDADTEEVLLSLVEGGKLTSPLMKEVGKGIRERRPLSIPVSLDLKLSINGQEVKGGEQTGTTGEGKGSETGTSKEADEKKTGQGQEDESAVKEVKGMYGPLPGTWESVQDKLRASIRTKASEQFGVVFDGGPGNGYVYLLATYSDSVVVCVEQYGKEPFEKYYRCSWHMVDGKPELYGDFKEVEIEVETRLKEKGLLSVAKAIRKAKEEKPAKDDEKEKPVCPKCGSSDIKDGVCQDCGYEITGDEKPVMDEDEKKSFEGAKLGRVLSTQNEGRIKEAVDYIDEGHKMEGVPKPCKACMYHARGNLKSVLDSLASEGTTFTAEIEEKVLSARELAAEFLAKATHKERKQLKSMLDHFDELDEKKRKAKDFREFLLNLG